jgi:hypothetical protein
MIMPDTQTLAPTGFESLSVPALGLALLRSLPVLSCALALIMAGKALPF